MSGKLFRWALGIMAVATLIINAGCSSSGNPSNNNNTGQTQSGTVNMMVSDASTDDWATIGVKILSIAFTPQGGGSPVTVYTAPSPTPVTNLVELDNLSDIVGSFNIPVGTYTGATFTISANPGDVTLITSADPETGFASPASTQIPTNQTQIQGTTGSSGSLTVPVKVTFDSVVQVKANTTVPVNVEFDLSHPAFLVGHVPPSGQGTVIWAVNFNGPVRHHPIYDITRLVLRHMYGTVIANGVSTDGSTITFDKDYPVLPPPSSGPETAVTTTQQLQVQVDSTNGTLYYDVDAHTSSTLKTFTSLSQTLPGKFIRVASRYQSNGTLVAVRLWASSSFNNVWLSPEGHVLHVNKSTNVVTVANEDGTPVQVQINANTQFFFRAPWNATADATPIGTGTSFIAAGDLVRGFKVHVSVNPLVTPYTADEVDIETAVYSGTVTNPTASSSSFVYTHNFLTAAAIADGDDYTITMPLISSSTANGKDPLTGNPISGFKWWFFTFPTQVNDGTTGVANFFSLIDGSANFGGNAAPVKVAGASGTIWGDPGNPTGWAARWAVLSPTALPLGTVASGWNTQTGQFTMTIPGGALAVPIALSTTSGSATLVYQVDRTNGVVTVSAVDITTSQGQATLTQNLIAQTPVFVSGIPQADGSIKAYVLIYYTGSVKPSAAAE